MGNYEFIRRVVIFGTSILFLIFIIMAILKLSNHNPTFEQMILVGGSIILGQQFYFAQRISKLEGKFDIFLHEFRDLKSGK